MDKQRHSAEERAKHHQFKTYKYGCHEIDVDPFPDLPLDKSIWGGPVHLKPP